MEQSGPPIGGKNYISAGCDERRGVTVASENWFVRNEAKNGYSVLNIHLFFCIYSEVHISELLFISLYKNVHFGLVCVYMLAQTPVCG